MPEVDLPKHLLTRIERVTRKRFLMSQAAFRAERAVVVELLRERRLQDSEIAELLQVTKQYLSKTFPRKADP